MRIAFDYQIFCLQAYGGISRYYARLAQHLALYRQETIVVAPIHCNGYLHELSPSLVKGLRISNNASTWMKLILPLNYVLSAVNISRWKPDVVHETYFSALPIKKAFPTVITVHDMVHELFPSEFSRLGNITKHKREALARADHIICISEHTRRDLLELYRINEKKISVIYHGFEGSPRSCQISYNRPGIGNRPFLLFVGNRGGYKNFDRFIRAYASSRRLLATFDIVAFGGGVFSPNERQLINSLVGETSRIRQIGGNDLLLSSLYSRASCLVYPSRYEGFGMPPLEAMAHDCPVTASNSSSIPEIVGDAGEYFDPLSLDEIKFSIESVVFSSARSCELISAGRKRLAHFSWARCAAATLSVYEKIQK